MPSIPSDTFRSSPPPSLEHEWVRRACRLALQPGRNVELAELSSESPDFDALYDVAARERVVPLLYHALGGAGLLDMVPQATVERMDIEYWRRVSQEILLAREAADVCQAISSAAAPPVMLKGLALAESLYPAPGLRLLSDVDLLLEADRMDAACEALSAMGYEPQEQVHPKRSVSKAEFVRRDREKTGLALVVVEVHSDLMRGMLDNRLARRLDVGELLERAEPWSLGGAPARVLEATDCLLFLATHLSLQHGFSDLLWLADLALLMQRRADALDWEAFASRAGRYGLRGAAYYPLACCRELLGVGPPEGVMTELKPPSASRDLLRRFGDAATVWKWNRWPGQRRAVIRRLLTLDTMGDRVGYAWEIVRRGGLGALREMPEH